MHPRDLKEHNQIQALQLISHVLHLYAPETHYMGVASTDHHGRMCALNDDNGSGTIKCHGICWMTKYHVLLSDTELHATVCADDATSCPTSLWQAQHAHNTGDFLTICWSSSGALRSLVDPLFVDSFSRCCKRGVLDKRLVLGYKLLIVTPVHVCCDWAGVDGVHSRALGQLASPSPCHGFKSSLSSSVD